jgi:nucleotide-binding universal stress UspA family protein
VPGSPLGHAGAVVGHGHDDVVAHASTDELAWVLRYREDVTASLAEETTLWSGKHPGVRWSLDVRSGTAAEVLRRYVDQHTLLVVGGRRHTPLAGRILGSVPDRLVRHAPCPVIVAHEQH